MDEADTLVIGGGIAGLACAVALADQGQRVLVLEGSDHLGGRAASCTDAATGDRVDLGPHILLSEYHNMLRLLERLGTRDRVVWQTDKFLTLVDRPHPVDVRLTRWLPQPLQLLPSLLKAPQVSLRDLTSNMRLLWRVMRLNGPRAQALDHLDAESVLRRLGVNPRFLDWFWRSASMAVMNVPLEHCSAGALLGFFRYMIGIPGYHVGFAGEGLGDLFAPPAQRIIEAAGGGVQQRSRVVAFSGGDEAVSGVRLADGRTLLARHCVAALPPADLLDLLPDRWLARHPAFAGFARFQPSPYVSTYLWFDRKLTPARFWTRVWSPQTLNYDFYDLSNIRPDWSGRGSIIASNIIHSLRADGLSDDDILATTLRELAEFAPDVHRARLLHARIHHIPMAIPAPHPGTGHLRPPAATPIRGLYLAGDWTATGLPASMESAVRSGWLAAEKVLAADGKPRQLASPLPAVQGLVRWIGDR